MAEIEHNFCYENITTTLRADCDENAGAPWLTLAFTPEALAQEFQEALTCARKSAVTLWRDLVRGLHAAAVTAAVDPASIHAGVRSVRIVLVRTDDTPVLLYQAVLDRSERGVALAKLRLFDDAAAELRAKLNLSAPHELLWEGFVDDNKEIEVRADGYGGAHVLYFESFGGCESYRCEDPQHFPSEDAACEAAAALYARERGEEFDADDA